MTRRVTKKQERLQALAQRLPNEETLKKKIEIERTEKNGSGSEPKKKKGTKVNKKRTSKTFTAEGTKESQQTGKQRLQNNHGWQQQQGLGEGLPGVEKNGGREKLVWKEEMTKNGVAENIC